MKKWTYELNKEFSKEEVQMASKYMKVMLNLPGYKRGANQKNP
jgi:hypothetical protein